MSVRVGHINRHEDVHGVSGEGIVADVFEATNGKCIVVWRSAHSSTNVYDHIKDVETTHSHGGKTLVIWDWESPPDPDPMDKLTEGPELSDEEIEDIADEAAQQATRIAQVKVAEKIAQKVGESPEPEDDSGLEELERKPSKEKEKPKKRGKEKEPKK